jgi:type IV secretory pathway VirB9-like protein
VKLKNVDEQTQTFEYTVSASTGVNYIHFDVQDNSGAISRKTLKISIGAEEQIAS